jgi:hypothetical protein
VSVESLQALKRLATIRRAQSDASVPADRWRAIYFSAIAAAARAGISDLGEDDVQVGYRWVLARPWLDGDLRSLIETSSR